MAEEAYRHELYFRKIKCPKCEDRDATLLEKHELILNSDVFTRIEECLKCGYVWQHVYLGYPFKKEANHFVMSRHPQGGG